MIDVPDLIETLSSRGVEIQRDGNNLKIRASSTPPDELIEELRQNKSAVLEYLIAQAKPPLEPPPLPEGVRLIQYTPKAPPIAITRWSVVNDVPKFLRHELEELSARLHNPLQIKAGMGVFEILDRLEQAGLKVEIEPLNPPVKLPEAFSPHKKNNLAGETREIAGRAQSEAT